MTVIRGIDVSHWQGALDWHGLAAAHRLDFAFTKATEAEGFVDPRFRSNWAGIREVGLIRGAYHFARPDTNAVDDARAFVATVKGAGAMTPTDLVALDLEVGAPVGVSLHGWATAWGAEVRKLLPGYSVGLYHSHPVGGFDWWWYARWPGITTWPTDIPAVPRSGTPDIWQWTDKLGGRTIDANVFGGTRAQMAGLNPIAGQPKPDPDPKPQPGVRVLKRLLRLADPMLRGDDVKAAQAVIGMNRADRDGVFGTQTEWHVKDWQRERRLVVDGIFGPQCCRAAGWRWAG